MCNVSLVILTQGSGTVAETAPATDDNSDDAWDDDEWDEDWGETKSEL